MEFRIFGKKLVIQDDQDFLEKNQDPEYHEQEKLLSISDTKQTITVQEVVPP